MLVMSAMWEFCKLVKTEEVPVRTASSMQKRSHMTFDRPYCRGRQSFWAASAKRVASGTYWPVRVGTVLDQKKRVRHSMTCKNRRNQKQGSPQKGRKAANSWFHLFDTLDVVQRAELLLHQLLGHVDQGLWTWRCGWFHVLIGADDASDALLGIDAMIHEVLEAPDGVVS